MSHREVLQELLENQKILFDRRTEDLKIVDARLQQYDTGHLHTYGRPAGVRREDARRRVERIGKNVAALEAALDLMSKEGS